MINRLPIHELNSHPTILITAAVIEFKTNKPNVAGIKLTYATAAAVAPEASQ
jgi:hypothetical protein